MGAPLAIPHPKKSLIGALWGLFKVSEAKKENEIVNGAKNRKTGPFGPLWASDLLSHIPISPSPPLTPFSQLQHQNYINFSGT